MKRALILTVGGSPEPVIHAVQQNGSVDFVWFVCSTGQGPAASDRTITQRTETSRTGECPHCKKRFEMKVAQEPIAAQAGLAAGAFEIVLLPGPDDFADAFARCDAVASRIQERFGGDDVEVIANYTGGTKTMSIALAVAAMRRGWTLQVNMGGRKDLLKVTVGDVAVAQDVAGLQADEALRAAEALFLRHDFDGARDTLDRVFARLGARPEVRRRMFELRTESVLWSAWDKWDLRQALPVAQSSPALAERYGARLKHLVRATDLFLEKITPWGAKDISGVELVEDLMANAERCAARGKYDDAVGRLYRATELAAQIRLLRVHRVRTGDVELREHYAPELRDWLTSQRDVRTGIVRLGLYASYEMLLRLDDPLGKYFISKLDILKGLIELRNQSLFAHGLNPVAAEAWREHGAVWLEWLKGAVRV